MYVLLCICLCVVAMKADRKRLKAEKGDLVSQMQQLYTTLESREDQLREFIRNYDQHRKVTHFLVKLLHQKVQNQFSYNLNFRIIELKRSNIAVTSVK